MTDSEAWSMEDELRALRRAERRRRTRRRQRRKVLLFLSIIAIDIIFFIVLLLKFLIGLFSGTAATNTGSSNISGLIDTEADESEVTEVNTRLRVQIQPDIDVDLLPVNEYSRPGDALTEVNGIVIHYTGNPGTTAAQNHSYFASLAETGEASASSHFVIGLEGEIIQCVPCDEIAYASNDRNCDTLSIECCIEDESGIFNDATYQSLIELVAWLMGQYDLDTDDVIRHYDVTGKLCPKYYAENPEAWEAFKEDLEEYIEEYGTYD